MTQTHTVRQRAWSTQGKLGLCDGEERDVQREAKLNDLRDTGSPREAKWPSVILRTQAGSAPTFSFSLQPLLHWPDCSGPHFIFNRF